MDLTRLSLNDRVTLGAGAVVVITALLSISNEWGALMFLSLAAGAGAIAVVLLPFVSPRTTLPTTKGAALLGLGATATVATSLSGLNWLGWIVKHFATFDTIQFLTGLAAAAVVLAIGLHTFQGERRVAAPPAA
jgi:hypothetical protein